MLKNKSKDIVHLLILLLKQNYKLKRSQGQQYGKRGLLNEKIPNSSFNLISFRSLHLY